MWAVCGGSRIAMCGVYHVNLLITNLLLRYQFSSVITWIKNQMWIKNHQMFDELKALIAHIFPFKYWSKRGLAAEKLSC